MGEASFQVQAGVLSRALKVASRVVEKRSTLPILSHILLEAEGGVLRITANDLDVQLEQKVSVNQDASFGTALPADKLTSFIGALADREFCRFEMEAPGAATIRAGRSRITLPALPHRDFPRLSDFDSEGVVQVSAETLMRMLVRVLPFVSREEARYYLLGPLWHGEEGVLALAAANGVAAFRDTDTDTKWPDAAPEVILAPKACRVVATMCEGAEKAFVQWDGALSRFSINGAVLTAKVIDGTYPDYRRIIPERRDDPVRVEPDLVKAALSRLRAAADARDNFIQIEAEASDALRLSMRSADGASFARETIPADVPGGMGSMVNIAPFGALIEAIGGESVEISQGDSQAIMRIERVVKDGAVALLSPSRNFRPTINEGDAA